MNRILKKTLKITAISLGSLIGVAVIVMAVALWLVFTPARLTPIVNKQAAKFLTCPAAAESVELTFFSSFPRLGIGINGLTIVNPTEGAPSDTLLSLKRINAVIDARAFLKNKELILSGIELRDGQANLFTDAAGATNFDILAEDPESEPDTTSTELHFGKIDIDRVALKNIDARYLDLSTNISASVSGISADAKALINDQNLAGDIKFSTPSINLDYGTGDSLMTLRVTGLSLAAQGNADNGTVTAGLRLEPLTVSMAYGGEQYLEKVEIGLNTKAVADTMLRKITLSETALSVNGIRLTLDGSVAIPAGSGNGSMLVDMTYGIEKTPLETILSLIPQSMLSPLDGISLTGTLASEGSVRGTYSDTEMPMLDLGVSLEEGSVKYPEMLPFAIHGINAEVAVHTDLADDGVSYLKIDRFAAHTPNSSLRASGKVDRLFSDPHAVVSLNMDASLNDAKPFIPDSLGVTAAGKLSGRLNADLRASDIEKMTVEKMKLSGSLLATGLSIATDSLSVVTPAAKLEFTLPNTASKTASFAAVSVNSDRLDVDMTGSGNIRLNGAVLGVEISDIRDTTSIPVIQLTYKLEHAKAEMDGTEASVAAPQGKLSIQPEKYKPTIPRIMLALNSNRFTASSEGDAYSFDNIDVDANIRYDEKQEDMWSRFTPYGTISLKGAIAYMTTLYYAVEVPELKMDFTPFEFEIEKAHVILNESDFSLSGKVRNILPYMRGDSILVGEFDFRSPLTDVSQLMNLTNGIGYDDETVGVERNANAEEFTGPYMVPKGVDLIFHTNISKAIWNGHEFSKIKGDLAVRDGKMLVTPELSFSSPATDGSVELEYRTPRKNQLYARVSLHLMDIMIPELIDLVPDVDTLMPMLRAFDGKGEFHLVASGNMDSMYRFKMSTLRGAASLTATDLTLKDEELFRRIAFLLKYKDEGKVRLDSLSAEMTIFRDKVDVLPFLLTVDRYKAVISGWQTLSMDFRYNISVVKSPLPFRLAVDIYPKGDDFKFKLGKSKFPDFYRPNRQNVVETQQMEMRNIIRNALRSKQNTTAVSDSEDGAAGTAENQGSE